MAAEQPSRRLVTPAYAQDEAQPVMLEPDAQFCNLVADDLEACEQALATLASGRLLPESFGSLISSDGEGAGGNGSGVTEGAIVLAAAAAAAAASAATCALRPSG